MPLVADAKSKAIADCELREIDFFDDHQGALRLLGQCGLFISYETLAQLDPFDTRGLTSAFEQIERFRIRIEAAASDKFDRQSDLTRRRSDLTIRSQASWRRLICGSGDQVGAPYADFADQHGYWPSAPQKAYA